MSDPLAKAQVIQLGHIGRRILRTIAPDHGDGDGNHRIGPSH
ncbi:hypothetical protein [Streptomyces sp. IBSBF 2806]